MGETTKWATYANKTVIKFESVNWAKNRNKPNHIALLSNPTRPNRAVNKSFSLLFEIEMGTP